MTVGSKSGQAGESVSLQGESEIRQQSSAADALTITLASGVTSTAGGQGLVVRRFAPEGASGGTEAFVVEYDGVRGRRHIVAMSSASSAITLSASDSGGFIVVPGFSSGATITLPAVAAGLSYELYMLGAPASGVVAVKAATTGTMVAFNDAAADTIVFGKAGGASGTTIGGSLRLHTDGTKWYSIMQPAFTSAAPTSATMTSFAIET